jgi:signal transduction histidine kinase
MNIIIITAMVTVIILCALAFKVARREDKMLADMDRRIKELEMNNNTEGK